MGQRTVTPKEIAKLERRMSRSEKRQANNISWRFQPLITYAPETDWGFGGLATHQFSWHKYDTVTPLSTVQYYAMYTLNEQVLISANFNLNPSIKWRFTGELGYNIYPYFFAGIGNDHNGKYWEWYDAQYPLFKLSVYRNIKQSAWYAVGELYTQHTIISNTVDGGLLASTQPAGYNGSVQLQPSIGAQFNTRNFQTSATKGWYAQATIGTNLTDYTNNTAEVDVRKYFALGANQSVIAVQIYGVFNSEQVPFNLLPQLGGNRLMRGYRQGVYRDQQMIVYQLAYRSRLVWELLSFSAFANMGSVASNWWQLHENYRYTYGSGVRLAVDVEKRQFIRFDFAFNKEFNGFYFAIGEAF